MTCELCMEYTPWATSCMFCGRCVGECCQAPQPHEDAVIYCVSCAKQTDDEGRPAP